MEAQIGNLFFVNFKAFWSATNTTNPSKNMLMMRKVLQTVLFHDTGLQACHILDTDRPAIAAAMGVC